MIWILAAQLSLPLALGHYPDVRAVFRAGDYPIDLQQAGKSGTVYTRTTVRPDGSIESCTVEKSSGNAELDAHTCGIIVKRAKFVPAKWTDGSPVYGVIRAPVVWLVSYGHPSEEDFLRASIPDLELSVDHLPKGAHSIAAVSLEIAADESGRPLTCVEWVPLKYARTPHFPELVPIACQQVMAHLTVIPPADASAKSVRSVQSVSVHFRIDH